MPLLCEMPRARCVTGVCKGHPCRGLLWKGCHVREALL